jgi:hypothetical protein
MSRFSVHNGTIAAAAAAQGKSVRVAANLELSVPECPQCQQYMVNGARGFKTICLASCLNFSRARLLLNIGCTDGRFT